ncbi:MAG: lysophospholipid acyltransferase family protein [Deltaproteobacteria bacterium]|nr:lysophospholipid acyltransferase family protein [Deltaproteobacteria bacterium]
MSKNKNHSDSPALALRDRLGYAAAMAGIWFVVGLTTLLGHRGTLALGKAIGSLLFTFFGRMQAKVLHNLGFAFGDALPERERPELARRIIQNFCQTWAELFFVAGPKKRPVRTTVTIEGREHLDRALAHGRGVIAVSAHMGNYPMIGIKLTEEGYHFVMVVRDLQTRAGSAAYSECRRMIDMPSLATQPEREFFKGALKTLRRGGILCLIADENKRHGGIFVDFFGQQASTAPGPAALAQRTGAAIVPMFMVRESDGSQRLIIEEEIIWERSGDTAADMQTLTALFTATIEARIRRDPDQWIWTNWRWRTQEWGKDASAKLRKKKKKRKT